ncbi:MAG: serine/threonine protein kinase [Planctomycetes bacterium]|nr:serine/threonine protein kinase [Planctomycetota bacterium]
MGISAQQVLDGLTSLSIIGQEDLAKLRNGLTSAQLAEDAETLLRYLVRKDKLSKYQAAKLYQERGKELVFGNYVIIDRIGVGGMGRVYQVRHVPTSQVRALKVLIARGDGSSRAIQRFLREVEVASQLSHPNIVTAYESGEAQGLQYLAMEFVDGQDLSTTVKQRGPLPLNEAISYILQAARGLGFAHGKGIVHRDVKPANLLLDKNGVVKILDLGIARIYATGDDEQSTESEGIALTYEGEIMGTADYMAPEQSKNTHTADARADIYSLGCTLYRLLTGAIPYSGDTAVLKIMAHHIQAVPSLIAARPEIPVELESIYQQMLKKDLTQRTQTMDEVIAALEPIAAKLAV